MTDIEITRGRRAAIDVSGLLNKDGEPATFGGTDLLLFTAKADIGQPDTSAILHKRSDDGGITIQVGTADATVNISATDFATITLNDDVVFAWDLTLLPGGVPADAVTLVSGDGTLKADISLNPAAATTPLAGTTCSPWATNVDAVLPGNKGIDPVELDLAMQIASDVLFGLTRRRWPGVCTDVVRPIARWRSYDGPPRWWPASMTRSSNGAPWGFCSCNRSVELGCSRIPELLLPGRPVIAESIEVKIDGNAFTDFELHDKYKLVRTDGEGWPCCQDFTLDDDQVGTYSVTYQFGGRPPVGGVRSAAVLGSNLAMAYHPDVFNGGECKLPKRVTTITRAGTTIAVLDPLKLFAEGLTGIPEVDLWVASVNAGDAGRRGRIIRGGHRSKVRRIG